MNNEETEYSYSLEEWVEKTSPRPGRLWQHSPSGYWYFDRSDLMAIYDTGAQQWKIYDYKEKQYYVYSENLFFCQTPVVKGVCQPQPAGPNVSGEYDTPYGRMILTQAGNVVTGTYKDGRIEGTLTMQSSGRALLAGKWFEGIRNGKLEFLFNPDLQSWDGSFGRGEEAVIVGNTWDGRRVG